MINHKIVELQKGGIIIDTSAGPVQLGVPPETIKDSLGMNREVPNIYIAPKNLFSYNKMASLIDIEFPCYYNFFIKKQRTRILCTFEQQVKIEKLMVESLFGPLNVDPSDEYDEGIHNYFYPDLRKEMDYFAKHPELDRQILIEDIIDFIILKDRKKIKIDSIQIELNKNKDKIIIHDNGVSEIDWNLDYKNPVKLSTGTHEKAFIPPHFGITTLGSSHGFDPGGKTSGFIFWINGSGILIDPPIDSSLWLLEENVDPGMINSVILTHCHGDHDAGIMQKILLEGRVKLYTTYTVFTSFVRKISVLTGLSVMELVDYIDFIPVPVEKNVSINGALFKFSYRLHSIPTIGFEVYFNGKSTVYTSDHLNDRKVFTKLSEEGVLTEGRYKQLCNFNWEHDIIIHEAGVPPMHTPIDKLLDLDNEIKEKIYLVHTDKSKIPAGSKLSIPESGLSSTMILDIEQTLYGESFQILNLVSGMDIFDDLNFPKAHEFLSIIKYEKFKKGDVLIEQGEQGRKFYIIVSGHAVIEINGVKRSILRSGCHFGETSLITGGITTGRIIAETQLLTLTISRSDFLMFISNTSIYSRLKKLGLVRKNNSWEALEANPLIANLTINQKNSFETLLEHVEPKKNEVIFKKGKPIKFAVLWHLGKGVLKQNKHNTKEIECGYFFGNPIYITGNKKPDFDLIAGEKSSFFKIDLHGLEKFFHNNPGFMLRLKNSS